MYRNLNFKEKGRVMGLFVTIAKKTGSHLFIFALWFCCFLHFLFYPFSLNFPVYFHLTIIYIHRVGGTGRTRAHRRTVIGWSPPDSGFLRCLSTNHASSLPAAAFRVSPRRVYGARVKEWYDACIASFNGAIQKEKAGNKLVPAKKASTVGKRLVREDE